MKHMKRLLIGLILVGATACSGTSVKDETVMLPPSNAVYASTASGGSVVIQEDSKRIEFKSLNPQEVALSIRLSEEKDVKRVLLYDGNEVIRVSCQGDGIVLSGENLEKFKAMIKGGNDITLKGRVGQQNYVSYKLNLGDTHVISQIFGSKELYVKR